jgi:WD40 repeat protein
MVLGPAQAIALVGMGGSGKSVLASAFARSVDARRAFPDGIVWLSLGESPDLLPILRLVGGSFGDDLQAYPDPQSALTRLLRLLSGCVCLLVLDDVWQVDVPSALLNVLGPRCLLLLTSRDAGVASALGAQEIPLPMLTDADALSLLADWTDEPAEALPAVAREVAEECENLPFALSLCGALVRGEKVPWADLRDALREADLGFIEKELPNYPFANVRRAMRVSVDVLARGDVRAAESYQALAVFPKGEPVPESAVLTLWISAGMRERDARKLLGALEQKGLLRLHGEMPCRWISLHHLQADYLRAAADLSPLHERLLEAYAQQCAGYWPEGPNDGYFFEHLPWHLAQAGRVAELRDLLADVDWIAAKLASAGALALTRDYGLVAADPDLQLIEQAIRLSTNMLMKRPAVLTSQLVGRLQSVDRPAVRELVTAARSRNPGAWIETNYQTLRPVGGCLVRTLEVHSDWVSAVAATPDGRFAVSASGDRTCALWDLESGDIIARLGHSDCVSAVAVTPDRRRAVSGSQDGSLNAWDLEHGKFFRRFEAHSAPVLSVGVTKDGRRAVSGSWDNTVKVWRLSRGTAIHCLTEHAGPVFAVAVTPDGKYAVSGSWDQTLILWDLARGSQIRTFKGHSDVVTAVALTDDGSFVLSGSWDHTVRLWSRANGEVYNFRGHSGPVLAVALTPGGTRAASGSWDNTVKVWDLDDGHLIRTLEGHSDSVHAVAISEKGDRVLSGSSDRTLKLWDLERRETIHAVKGHCYPASSVALAMDGKRAVSGSGDETLWLWDYERAEVIRKLEGHAGYVCSVAVTPDGKRAVSGSNDKSLKYWDLDRGGLIHTLEGHSDHVCGVALTSDGTRAVSGSRDRTVKLWGLERGELIRTLEGHTDTVLGVAVMPDGTRAVSASRDGTVRYWDLATGGLIGELQGHSSAVTAVAITPDGKIAVSGSWDSTIKIWSLERGEVIHTLEGHSDAVLAVAVTPDGKRALSGSDDSTLILWDLDRYAEIAAFGGDSAITACAMLPDGATLIAAEASGQVHFLSLRCGGGR